MGRRRKKGRDVHGWLVLDKPYEMGSTRAVAILKRLYDAKKVGHAGTLDPLATGVLPIAFGEATKTVPFAVDDEKAYRYTVSWGMETTTDDREGEVVDSSDNRPLARDIEGILEEFVGQVSQVPPRYSAVRINGERAYKLAREGEDPEMSARLVDIYELDMLEHGQDSTVFRLVCGKGTYVRALARDMGRMLGCFGHVSELRRTQVGNFLESDTISLEKLEDIGHSADDCDSLLQYLKPVESVLDDIPALNVDSQDAARLKNGQAILIRGRDAPIMKGVAYAISGGNLIALGEVDRGALHPTRVFNL